MHCLIIKYRKMRKHYTFRKCACFLLLFSDVLLSKKKVFNRVELPVLEECIILKCEMLHQPQEMQYNRLGKFLYTVHPVYKK